MYNHRLPIKTKGNIIYLPVVMFLIFLLFVILTDVFGYYLADLTLSPKPQTDLYEKCLTLRKIVYDNQCWELLTKGPCDTG